MEERNIEIEPYKVKNNLIKLTGEVRLDSVDGVFLIEDDKLNLYGKELSNGEILIPRTKSKVMNLKITPKWEAGNYLKDVKELLHDDENISDAVLLRLRIKCDKTCWSGEQHKIKLSEIGKKVIEAKIPLSELSEEIEIESFITREVKYSKEVPLKATERLSILSQNEAFKIQIDNMKTIGGNFLPIEPKKLKDLLFQFSEANKHDIPIIYYSDELEEFFKRNNLMTVNNTFIFIMPAFLEHYLKWVIFTSQSNPIDKEYDSLVEKLSTLCKCEKSEMYEVISDNDTEKKLQKFLEWSKKLFEEIQYKSGISFRNELLKNIKLERKLKKEIQ
ncbi:MAG TPA: hypothetical protein VJY62_18455 [Bacteroidia bacterium]|nr:hypothetical protein [Bacteroidia bacterium]